MMNNCENHNHDEHYPMPGEGQLMCKCGKTNTECHPCPYPDRCYYREQGCQHPRMCQSIHFAIQNKESI